MFCTRYGLSLDNTWGTDDLPPFLLLSEQFLNGFLCVVPNKLLVLPGREIIELDDAIIDLFAYFYGARMKSVLFHLAPPF
jgi:hypothetical protein